MPDFSAKLDKDLNAFEKNCEALKTRHLKVMEEARSRGDLEALSILEADLKRMEYQWKTQKEIIMESWKNWKDGVLQKESDKDFMRGVGIRYLVAEDTLKTMQERHPSFPRPIVGYVEVHQWHNEGSQRIQDGFTNFQDLLDENWPMNWWIRTRDVMHASSGHYLYAVLLGGTLQLINFNPDSSD